MPNYSDHLSSVVFQDGTKNPSICDCESKEMPEIAQVNVETCLR